MRVQLYPPPIDSRETHNRIRAAAPVIGPGQHRELALLTAHLMGRGSTLISANGAPMEFSEPNFIGGIDDGTSETFRYWTWPHEQNPTRVWYVSLSRWVPGVRLFGTLTTDSGATANWEIPADAEQGIPITFELYETLVAPSDTPREAVLSVAHSIASHDTAQVFVIDVSCQELPRTILGDFGGVTMPDLDSLDVGRLIYQDSTASKSLHAIAIAAELVEAQARRACQMSYFNHLGLARAAGSFATAVSGFALARKRYSGDFVGPLMCAVYVEVTGGEGEVRITAASGDVETLTIAPNGGPDWFTREIHVNCDDMDNMDIDGGLADGSVHDSLTFATRVTTGTEITLYGACVGEAE